MTWYVRKQNKTKKAKLTYGNCFNRIGCELEGLCDIWRPVRKSPSFYLISFPPPPSFLLSPSLSQTLQERDPNKVKGKQFSHHKPYYSVYPGVLPCRFI